MSGAAAQLGVAKSIVSRRVGRLEAVLGAQLLTRSPKGTTPTDIGRAYHARAGAGLAELEAAQEVVSKLTTEISGPLRIQVQTAFGEFVLAPLLAEFALLYPLVQLDILFEDRVVDITAEGYDLSIWVNTIPDQTLVTRRLARIDWIVAASPGYLDARGRPECPAELLLHDAILHVSDSGHWRLQGQGGWEHVRMNSRIRASNGHMLVAATRAGLGMTLLPRFMAADALARGELEEVLPGFTHEGADLQVFMPATRCRIARVRALLSFLYERISPQA